MAGGAWYADNLVFCHENGTGIGHWHAHEGRHTAVSVMSSNGVPIQDISDTVGTSPRM